MNAPTIALRRNHCLLLLLAVLSWLAVLAADAHAQDESGRRKILRRTGFLGPQLSVASNGSVYLLWAKTHGEGFDLFLASREPGGLLGEAQRMNERPGSVDFHRLDELRPALATGPEGQAAAGWLDDESNVHVALFEPEDGSITRWQLNADGGNPVRGFVSLDFDERGRLYAVWLDARAAKRGEEEPAQLYGVVLLNKRARAREQNLTAAFTESVCGCCRPSVVATRAGIEVFVRNVGEDGYRDIYRGEGSMNGGLTIFDRIGPPTWKIEACPMSGAVSDGRLAWWRDGSTGVSRLVEGTVGSTVLRVALAEDDDWTMAASPRLVEGSDDQLLFIPGDPRGRLLRRDGGKWRVVRDDLPQWCRSIIEVDGQLLLVGDDHSELKLESASVEGGE